MTATVEVRDIAQRWSELLAAAAAGNEVIVVEGDVPKARIVSLARPRTLGLHPGAIEVGKDFEEPLPDAFWTGNE